MNRHRFDDQLTAYFGTEQWKELAGRRITSERSLELRQSLSDLDVGQLGQRWQHAGKVLDVYRRGEQHLYRMLFASNHIAGKRIAAWAGSRAARARQIDLF